VSSLLSITFQSQILIKTSLLLVIKSLKVH